MIFSGSLYKPATMERTVKEIVEMIQFQSRFAMLAIFLMVTTTIVSGQRGNVDECVRLWFQQKPELRNRFTTEQVRWLCERTSDWLSRALNPSATTVDDVVTPRQRSYLNQLRACTGAQCLQLLNNPVMDQEPQQTTRRPTYNQRGRRSSEIGDDDTRDKRQADQRAIRKEIRMMTNDERRRYLNAVVRLKTDKIDSMSKYDLFVVYHTPEEAPGAHWGPAFLPYHREYMKQYELALRQVDPSVGLPYWDSTLDEGLPNPRDSILWTEEFFGNGDGLVRSGPFANFNATHELSSVPGMRSLFRDVGNSQFGGLYKEEDVAFVMNRQTYNELTSCVDPTFELVHGIVHMFVGGYMSDIGISPNDPTFYNHHCFLDYLWEQFRQNRQNANQRESTYPSDDQSCNNFHYGDSTMRPFTIRNKDGMSNVYTRELYTYQQRPSCSAGTCNSPYLFCANNRCLSKVKTGGACNGFEGTDICYNGQCRNGRCVATDFPPTTQPTIRTTRPTRPRTTTTTVWTQPPVWTWGPVEPQVTDDPRPPPPSPPPYVIPDYPIVWFTCTVQKGNGNFGPPPTDVSIRTIGQNVPLGYRDVLPGNIMTDENYPSYKGAAVLQIRDPKSTGYTPMVEFKIEANDGDGRQCYIRCYNNMQRQYGNCNNKFRFSTNSYYSDPIKTDQSQLTALESTWANQGSRSPDYILIQCP